MRDEATSQTMLNDSPQAVWYYSDLFATYDTHRVAGVNAGLRHYLARLKHKTRRFSKWVQALIWLCLCLEPT